MRRKSFFITVAVILVAFAIYYPFSPAGVQARNMAKARAHIPTLQRALGSDPGFADIRFQAGTNQSGCLLVMGSVPSRTDLYRLRETVFATSPPTAVIFRVIVEDEMESAQTAPSR